MKKTVLLIVGLLLSASAYGQFSFGLKGGFTGAYLTHTNISRQIEQSYDPANPDGDPIIHYYDFPAQIKIGTYIGMFFEYKFNDKYALQSDVTYSEQGCYFNIVMDHYGGKEREDEKDKIRLIINYFNIPVVFKYYVLKDQLSVDVGAQFGIRLESTFRRITQRYNLTPERTHGPLGTSSYDVSLVAGISYYLNEHFDLHARFTAGITNTLSPNPNIDPTSKKQANNVIYAGLGYRF